MADNQLRTLAHIGLVMLPEVQKGEPGGQKGEPGASAPGGVGDSVGVARSGGVESPGGLRPPLAQGYPRFADPHDRTASLESRTRAYLHVNCAHCHRYGGGGTASFQLQYELPTAGLGIVDRPPAQGTFGLTDAKLVAAGYPQRSVLLYRMAKLGGGRMPHIASDVVDTKGVRLIQQWIEQLSQSPPEQSDFARQLCDPQLSVEKRQALLRTFLSHPSGSLLLLCALDDNMPAEVAKEAITRGTTHEDSRIRDLFERFLTEEKRPRRLGSQIHPQALLAVPGDAARGRELYANLAGLSCRNCHRIGGNGGEAGSALDQIGKKLSRAQILESVLELSKLIEEKYIKYLVVTKDGVPYTGVLTERAAEGIVLRDAEDKSVRLKNAEIEELTRQRQSLMPEGLLSNLTAQQAADLLSYLESCK